MYSNTLTHISSHTYTHTNHTPFILTHPEMLTLISNTLTHALAHSHLLPHSHSNTPILIFKDEYALSHRHTDSHNQTQLTHTYILMHRDTHSSPIPTHTICVIIDLLAHPRLILTYISLEPRDLGCCGSGLH